MRIHRALMLPLALAPLAIAAAASASVNPANLVKAGKHWHTCVPQATSDWGIYQRDNDLFTGSAGPSCITADGSSITIDRNLRPVGASVGAYPVVRIGAYPYNRDPGSGLPEEVGHIHHLTLRIANTGDSGGVWIDDLDLWFARDDTPATAHIREMIIITRWGSYSKGVLGTPIKVGHRHWYVVQWITHHGSQQWPLIRFIARSQTRHAYINVAAFLKIARHWHWITDGMDLSSISEGTECWSGCKGLTDSMTVER